MITKATMPERKPDLFSDKSRVTRKQHVLYHIVFKKRNLHYLGITSRNPEDRLDEHMVGIGTSWLMVELFRRFPIRKKDFVFSVIKKGMKGSDNALDAEGVTLRSFTHRDRLINLRGGNLELHRQLCDEYGVEMGSTAGIKVKKEPDGKKRTKITCKCCDRPRATKHFGRSCYSFTGHTSHCRACLFKMKQLGTIGKVRAWIRRTRSYPPDPPFRGTPEYHKMMSEANKRAQASPALKRKKRETMLNKWKDETYQQNHAKGMANFISDKDRLAKSKASAAKIIRDRLIDKLKKKGMSPAEIRAYIKVRDKHRDTHRRHVARKRSAA